SAKGKKAMLVEFDDILATIRRADKATAKNISSALGRQLGKLYAIIADTTAPAHERLLASKEARLRLLELQHHYEGIKMQMRHQHVYFMQTAAEAASAFLDTVYNEMDAYFEQVYNQVEEVLRRDSTWATGLVDMLKKTGGKGINYAWKMARRVLARSTSKDTVNVAGNLLAHVTGERAKRAAEILERTVGSVHEWMERRGERAMEERTLLEKALERVCSQEEITAHLKDIFAHAARACEEVWNRRVKAYYEEVRVDPAVAGTLTGGLRAQPEFTLGAAEHTLAASLGATIFGTAALAAGWHTLAYAMVNVFWPLSVFVAVVTVGVAIRTKERAINKRIAQARKVLKMYHDQLVKYMDTEQLPEYGGKTLRQAISDANQDAARELDARWSKARFGHVPVEVYEELVKKLREEQRRLQAIEGELEGRIP
ncbi:MAG: hypothetical protein N2595_10770, partial [bacterium]|nr:hypothetical protein [bacterium]